MNRLLILRPDNLGDLVLFSGALKLFRRKYAGYRISLCAKEYVRGYFEHCPHLDHFLSWETVMEEYNPLPDIPWYPRTWRGQSRLRQAAGRWRRRRLAKKLSCDTLLIPVRSPQFWWTEFVAMIPAREKVGLTGNTSNCNTPQEHENYIKTLTHPVDASDLRPMEHEFTATLRFLHGLGIKAAPDDIWPEHWTTPEDATSAGRLAGTDHPNLVILAPGKSSLAAGVLPASFYESVFSGPLASPISVIILGTASEKENCLATAAALKSSPMVREVICLAGKTSIRQTIELLKLARAVISLETATLHLAVMLRRPVIGIVGGGHFGRFFPWGNPATVRAAYQQMDCFGCNWRCIFDTVRCLTELNPAIVTGHLQELLGQREAVGVS
jgi:ADP-heptose:LPS heptosyltransferase